MIEPSLAIGLFSTPVVVIDLPGMEGVNAQIAAQLLAEEQAVPSWQRANVGGWHSVPDLSQRPQPCYPALLRAVVEQVTGVVRGLAADMGIADVPAYRYGVTAWGMILRDGHYVTVHDHGDVHWSVAYYVDAGDSSDDAGGLLVFGDPRAGAGMVIGPSNRFDSASTIEHRPRTGELLIFPSWLVHWVTPYASDHPRISVSFNSR